MKTNNPRLNEMDSTLNFLDIKLESIPITLTPIKDITLNPIDVTLQTLPVNLDNTLFNGVELTSFEDLGGLV